MTTTPPTAAPIGRSELLGELYRIARRLMPVEASASEETTDACGASARLLAIADGWRDEDAALHAEMRRAAGWPVGILRFDALADHTTERAAAMVAELCTAREAIDDWRNATAAETPHDARERRKDMESAIGQEHERTTSLSTLLAERDSARTRIAELTATVDRLLTDGEAVADALAAQHATFYAEVIDPQRARIAELESERHALSDELGVGFLADDAIAAARKLKALAGVGPIGGGIDEAVEGRIASLESDLAVATGNAESRATHAAATVRARRESEGRLHERIAGLEAREAALVAAVDEAIAFAQAICNMGPIDTASTEKVSRDDHPWLSAPAMYLDRAAPAWLQRLEKLRDAHPPTPEPTP